ncbi:SH3 domain-binding glutamic acid-rich-like protein 3 [Amia ocellicauda]|uniref:SH3 domain-binding glutamic acid-rich-like protein 3 n=1 Tax=Amia ocellicauda TaxID=2972642 RepID=UPI0034646008
MVRSGLGGSGAGAAIAGEETHKDGRRPAAMVVKLYYTTVTASREVKSQQSEVMRILESKGIQFELIDISVGNAVREEMRTKAGKPTAVPPQIFNGDDYCGDYQMFSEAVEDDAVEKFLKLD